MSWRVVQHITSDDDHDCFGEISSNLPRRVIQYFYRNSVVSFREQKAFVLKTVILLAFGLGICEGVGEDSRHGIGHVDIRVGSCNYLNVFFAITCALWWGVTQVGNYHYWLCSPSRGITISGTGSVHEDGAH